MLCKKCNKELIRLHEFTKEGYTPSNTYKCYTFPWECDMWGVPIILDFNDYIKIL
jgi:uncharacterized protein with PIN domain